jgi:amidase
LSRREAEKGGGRGLVGAEFSALLESWDDFRSEALRFFQGYDVLLSPVATTVAPPHGTGDASAFGYTQYFSLTGWPCAVVPGGWDGGLPLGLQIVARPLREDVALRVAAFVEAELGGWRAPPARQP